MLITSIDPGGASMLHVMVAFEQATPEVEGNCGSQLLRPPMKWSLNGADGNVWRRATRYPGTSCHATPRHRGGRAGSTCCRANGPRRGSRNLAVARASPWRS
jgi:hypothetical protein